MHACMHTYIYIYTCIYVYNIFNCIQTYIVYVHTFILTYITYIHTLLACMHTCMHTDRQRQTYRHTDTQIYRHTAIQPCRQTDRPTYIHTSIHPYIHASMHPCTHASMYPRINTSIHPYIHPSIHPYIHTSIHPSIHIYMLFVFYIHMHMFTPSIIIYPHYGPKISSMLSRAIVGLYQRPLDGGSTADFGTHEPWPGNPNHGDQQSQRNVSETSSYNHICIFIYIPGKKNLAMELTHL